MRPQRTYAKRIYYQRAYKGGAKSSGGYSKSKARGGKRFKSKYNKVARYNPRGSIFGKQYFAKLKYQSLVELTTVTSSMAIQTFKLNSLYDPDYTGVGGQPLFFDTLCGATNTAAPFANYRVCGAKVKAYFINDNTSTSSAGAFYIHWRYGGAGPLDSITELGEQPNTRLLDINSGNGPYGIRCLKQYVSMKKMMAIKDLKDDDTTAGPYNSDPGKIVYFDVGYQPYQASIDTSMFIRIKITFYAQFFSQNEMLQS